MSNITTQVTFGKSRAVPFVVKDALGVVDTTTVATVGSNQLTKTRAVIDPADPRSVIVSALQPTTGGNTLVTVTALGHSDSFGVFTPQPPDLTAVVIGTPGPEFDTP